MKLKVLNPDFSESSSDELLGADSPISGRRIAFVGKLGSMNRREARDLVRRHDGIMVDRIEPTVDLIVIGADVLPLGDQAELLDDWVIEANAHGRIRVIYETQFWQELGIVEPDLDIGRFYTPAMLAGLLDLPLSTIRRWHRRGLITPTRQVNKLASGATPQSIETKLSRLAGLYPNLQRPLTQLSVIIEGRHLLLRQGGGLIEPGGQMRIDFDSFNPQDSIDNQEISYPINESTAPVPLEELETPDEFLRAAIDFEDEDDAEGAIAVYRAMSLAFGPSSDSSFRLAELLYQQGDLQGARERYFLAIELDESFVEARASLGCVLVELGNQEMALATFHGALTHHAEYPDVHFYLARLLDEMDRKHEAEPHWQTFLDLAPKSPWAEEARQRLDIDH